MKLLITWKKNGVNFTKSRKVDLLDAKILIDRGFKVPSQDRNDVINASICTDKRCRIINLR
jgi:hypothetical protein